MFTHIIYILYLRTWKETLFTSSHAWRLERQRCKDAGKCGKMQHSARHVNPAACCTLMSGRGATAPKPDIVSKQFPTLLKRPQVTKMWPQCVINIQYLIFDRQSSDCLKNDWETLFPHDKGTSDCDMRLDSWRKIVEQVRENCNLRLQLQLIFDMLWSGKQGMGWKPALEDRWPKGGWTM